MESTPAMQQATCTECDEEQNDFRSFDREHEMMPDEPEDAHITRSVRCQDCGATGTIKVTYAGTEGTGCVSFEYASWNQEGDDE